MPPEAEPQEKLNALTESQRLSARTAAKPRHAVMEFDFGLPRNPTAQLLATDIHP